MSACHTGLGQAFPGEGVLGPGLAGAFKLAGAKRVLASQGTVRDSDTDLMNEFYAQLSNIHEVGAALRQAQKKLRNREGRAGWPLFWAGLRLIGEIFRTAQQPFAAAAIPARKNNLSVSPSSQLFSGQKSVSAVWRSAYRSKVRPVVYSTDVFSSHARSCCFWAKDC